MAANDDLKQQIVQTLSSSEVHKIRFTLGSRRVDNALFNGVIDRLRKTTLHVVVNPSFLNHDDAAAEYVSRRRSFVFSSRDFGQTTRELGVLVHESVHAGFDVIGHGDKFQNIDNEPSAYLAEALFLINSGFAFDDLHYRGGERLNHALAFTIASNMVESKDPSMVSQDDLLLLRNGVARQGIFLHGEDSRDGSDDSVSRRGIPP